MAFTLKTIAFVVLAVAITVACISATMQMPRDHNLVVLPRTIIRVFAYLVLLVSITKIIFDKSSNRPFYGGVAVVLLGYFLANPIGLTCNLPTGAWLEVFNSTDVRAASEAADIFSVGGWVLLSVAVGVYAQSRNQHAKGAG